MSTLTIQQITHQSLQVLEKEFDRMYKTIYIVRPKYGKYAIYKSEYCIELDVRRTTTLARGLDKTTATGMMKLLEDKND